MVELHLGDALEVMRSLRDESVDAIITDPPYGTTKLAWDEAPTWESFWREAYRVCRPHSPQVMFSAQPFTTDLISTNRTRFRYDLIWSKTMPTGFLDAKVRPLRAHEVILVFSERPINGAHAGPTYNPQKRAGDPYFREHRAGRAPHYSAGKRSSTTNTGDRYPTSVVTFSNGNNKNDGHPTQKPVDLMRWLVRTFTDPGHVVLDPFMGSGTTGVAAVEEGRSFVGIELEPEYHAIAARRIDTAQPALVSAAD